MPTRIAPAHGSLVDDATPLFSWNVAANASRYFIYVDDNPDLSSPIIERYPGFDLRARRASVARRLLLGRGWLELH